METKDSSKAKVSSIKVRKLEPLGQMHVYRNFADADRHLLERAKTFAPDFMAVYGYEILWDEGYSFKGELSIDSSVQKQQKLIQNALNLGLANSLLLYSISPPKDELRKMVLRLQWQMERLMQDQHDREAALNIITKCEGVDEKSILSSYENLREMTDHADMFLSLLKKVFPNAQQKLENIRNMKNRSRKYIDEATQGFQQIATEVISAALNNESKLFDESWEKLIRFCVHLSEEQKIADERLTTLGRKIYHISKSDADLIEKKIYGLIKPFSEESSQEFLSRDMKIKRSFYGKSEKAPIPKRKEKSNEMAMHIKLYAKLYADGYAIKEGELVSRRNLSVYAASMLQKNHSYSQDLIKSVILMCDPMAVQFPEYPEVILEGV